MLGWFGVEVISNYGLLLWILGLPLDRFSTLIRDRRLCWWSAGFSFHYLRLTFTGRSSFEQMLQSANQRDEINVEQNVNGGPYDPRAQGTSPCGPKTVHQAEDQECNANRETTNKER